MPRGIKVIDVKKIKKMADEGKLVMVYKVKGKIRVFDLERQHMAHELIRELEKASDEYGY